MAQLVTLALALVGNFDSVVGAWREPGASRLLHPRAGPRRHAPAARAADIAEEVADYAGPAHPTTAIAEVFGEMPELRDAMALSGASWCWLRWRDALFVIAGWGN